MNDATHTNRPTEESSMTTIIEIQELPLPDGYYWSRSNAGDWHAYSHDSEDSGPYPVTILAGKIVLVGA